MFDQHPYPRVCRPLNAEEDFQILFAPERRSKMVTEPRIQMSGMTHVSVQTQVLEVDPATVQRYFDLTEKVCVSGIHTLYEQYQERRSKGGQKIGVGCPYCGGEIVPADDTHEAQALQCSVCDEYHELVKGDGHDQEA